MGLAALFSSRGAQKQQQSGPPALQNSGQPCGQPPPQQAQQGYQQGSQSPADQQPGYPQQGYQPSGYSQSAAQQGYRLQTQPWQQSTQPAYQQQQQQQQQQQSGASPGGGLNDQGLQTALHKQLKNIIKMNRLQAYYPPHRPQRLQQVQERIARVDFRALAWKWSMSVELAVHLVALALYDIVIYANDGRSMTCCDDGSKIDDLTMVLERVTEVATLFDADGISVSFINAKFRGDKIRDSAGVANLVAMCPFTGMSPLGTEMYARILRPMVEGPIASRTMQKPVLVITITDGEPIGEKQSKIVKVIKAIKRVALGCEYGPGAVAFEFAQVGKDTDAQAFLGRLDNDRDVGGMIGATSCFEFEAEEYRRRGVVLTPELWMVKLMLGAIDLTIHEQIAKENQAAGVHTTESPDMKGSEVPEAAQAASEFAEKVNLSAKPKTKSWAAANIPTPKGEENNETPLWQQLARLAPQTYGFYNGAADSLQSIDSGPGVFTEVFSHFSTLCQGITGSAGALVPGLYVVAVGLKVLDQIVVTNATADGLTHRLHGVAQSMVTWLRDMLHKAVEDDAIAQKVNKMLTPLGEVLKDVVAFVEKQPKAWAFSRMYTAGQRQAEAKRLQDKLDDFLKQLQVAGLAINLAMHQMVRTCVQALAEVQETLEDMQIKLDRLHEGQIRMERMVGQLADKNQQLSPKTEGKRQALMTEGANMDNVVLEKLLAEAHLLLLSAEGTYVAIVVDSSCEPCCIA
ncbi:hypothetical protein ABBQ32_000644 [Trebouxia sp. C0010 RCD-2024]